MIENKRVVHEVTEGKGLSGFAFLHRLDQVIATAKKDRAPQVPGLLAGLVVSLPTTQAGWEYAGVRPRRNGDLYQSAVRTIFKHAETDTELTRTFLDTLTLPEHEVAVAGRLQGEILEAVFVDSLTTPGSQAEATDLVVTWASHMGLSREDINRLFDGADFSGKPSDELKDLVRVLGCAHPRLSIKIEYVLRMRNARPDTSTRDEIVDEMI